MDKSSFFVKGKALFGGFPTNEDVSELENSGVIHFIDLTYHTESGVIPYLTKGSYINYPIRDHDIPYDWASFSGLILKISSLLKKLKHDEKIYLHCKGGHGRAGLVVACLLCYLYKIPAEEALVLTNEYHSQRKIMREKWRKLGSPQTKKQRDFVGKFFKNLYFYRPYQSGSAAGLSNFSEHSVTVTDIGTFPTAEAAFNALKNPTDKEYIISQLKSKTPLQSKYLGKKCKIRGDWEENKTDIMYSVLSLKFKQHDDIRMNLINTGLRPLVNTCKNRYWGVGEDGVGRNVLGKLLQKLRSRLQIKEFSETGG